MLVDKVQFLAKSVELAERAEGEDLHAKFVLCDFGSNLNHVRLDRAKIDGWKDTIVNEPLVGRLNASNDFEGHNMRIVLKPGTKEREVIFSTEAYGTFTDCAVEEVDGHEYICANAVIWARYPNVVRLIEDRVNSGEGLNTSWEILVSDSYLDPISGDKVITDGKFTALCMLGRNVTPAYGCSGLLEVAEADEDLEFEEALAMDMAAVKESEQDTMDNEDLIVSVEESEAELETQMAEEESSAAQITVEPEVNAETEVEPEEAEEQPEVQEETSEEAEPEPEVSALTTNDVCRLICQKLSEKDLYPAFVFPEEHLCWARRWGDNECDFVQYAYSVNGDQVEISGEGEPVRLVVEPRQINAEISKRDDALNQANEKINTLQAQVDALEPYRAEHEKAEAERIAAEHEQKVNELKAYALRSGHVVEAEFESDEHIKAMISELDEAGIKQLIAERFMASLENKSDVEPETAEAKKTVVTETAAHVDVNQEAEPVKYAYVMAYINSKN